MIIVSRDEEELEKSSFGRISGILFSGSRENSLGTRLAYRVHQLLQLSAVSTHERGLLVIFHCTDPLASSPCSFKVALQSFLAREYLKRIFILMTSLKTRVFK